MTHYIEKEIVENDEGWIFYEAAFKCWKAIYLNLIGPAVLDIGCASGTMMALTKIFKPDFNAIGFEGSADAAEKIWAKRNLVVMTGDINALPFPDNSFDTVYTSHVLEHCINPAKVLDETIRISRKRIIHIVPDGDVSGKNFGSPHRHIFNRQNFLKPFETCPVIEKVLYQSIPDFHMNSLIAVYDVRK